MEKLKHKIIEWEYKNMLIIPILIQLGFMGFLFFGLPD